MSEFLDAVRLILATAAGWCLYLVLAGVVFTILYWWWQVAGKWAARWDE